MAQSDEVFHVIGYTNQDISSGAMLRLLELNTRVLKSNEALWKQFGPMNAAVEAGRARREPYEVLSITPFLFDGDELPAAIQKLINNASYMALEFFSDSALKLCRENNIEVPRVLAKITRAELPATPHLGITLRGVSYKRA